MGEIVKKLVAPDPDDYPTYSAWFDAFGEYFRRKHHTDEEWQRILEECRIQRERDAERQARWAR